MPRQLPEIFQLLQIRMAVCKSHVDCAGQRLARVKIFWRARRICRTVPRNRAARQSISLVAVV